MENCLVQTLRRERHWPGAGAPAYRVRTVAENACRSPRPFAEGPGGQIAARELFVVGARRRAQQNWIKQARPAARHLAARATLADRLSLCISACSAMLLHIAYAGVMN